MFRRFHRPRYRLLQQQSRRNTSAGIFKNPRWRRLAIQQLEPRRVLANMLNVELNLFEDDGGVPGELIANNTVMVDQTFFVQLNVEDLRDPNEPGVENNPANNSIGITALSAVLAWDPAVLEGIDDPFSVAFLVGGVFNENADELLSLKLPTLRSASLDNAGGKIDVTGGSSLPIDFSDTLGKDAPEQASLFRFRAESAASQSLISVFGGGGLGDLADFIPTYEGQLNNDFENLLGLPINVVSGASPELSIADATIAEDDSGTMNLDFSVTLSEAAQAEVTVDFATADGTAVAQNGMPGDYVATTGTLTFATGETTKQVSVPIVDDATPEDTETFSVQLSNLMDNGASPSVLLARDTATGTITDTDVPIAVSILEPSAIVEGDSGDTTLMFEVAISGAPSSDVMVDFTTADGSATVSDSDYVAIAGTVTFAANDATSQFVSVQVTGDTKVELDESFTVAISNVRGAPEAILDNNDAMANGTISNDDMAAISISDVTMDEGDPGSPNVFSFAVTLDNLVDAPVTLNYTTVDGTATVADDDYTATSDSLTFAANNNDSQTILVAITGDDVGEPDEMFSVQLSGLMADGRDVQIANGGTGTGTIQNDDDPGIFISDVMMNEGADGLTTEFIFTVSIGPPQPNQITVVVNSEDGTATAASGDYTPIVGEMLTFGPNEASKTVSVIVAGDATTEDNETFSLKLSDATGIAILDDTGLGTILNDDIAEINISDAMIDPEDETTAMFTVTMSREVDADVTVDFATSDVTATVAGSDYDAQNGTLTFAPGETEKTIVVTIHDDNIVEQDETFNVELSNLMNGGRDVMITKGTGVGEIIDDDSATIAIDDVTMAESDSGQVDYIFTVTMTGIVDTEISYDFSTVGGTALNGQSEGDFNSTNGTMTFPAGGNAVKTQTITVQVNGDQKVELDEMFTVELSNLQASGRGVSFTNATGTGTIENDDMAEVTIGDVTVTEGNDGTTTATFTANLSNEVDTAVMVNVATSDGSAQNESGDGDYQSANDTLTFAAGSTSAMFSVNVNGDTKLETDETFNVTLSGLAAGTPMRNVAIQDALAVGTIDNDDAVPTLSIDNVEIAEPENGTVNLTFTVTMSNASGTDVTVDFATMDGLAEDENGGGDYQSASGTLTFAGDPSNSVQQLIMIQVNADNVSELTETFTVALSNAQGASIANGTGVGTITDDPMNAELRGDVLFGNDALTFGIPGVEITLLLDGSPIAARTTDSLGKWAFTGLNADEAYEIVQQDLSAILLPGQDSVGTQGGDNPEQDRFTNVPLTAGQVGTDNIFRESSLALSMVSKRNFLSSSPSLAVLLSEAIAMLPPTTANGVATITADDNPVQSESPVVAQVTVSGNVASVSGTDANDVFQVIAGDTAHTITVNDSVHTVSASDVSTIHIAGGGGDDVASLIGNTTANQVELGELTATLTNQASTYFIDVRDVEAITVHGNGSDDEALLLDSPDDNLLVAEAEAVTLSGENFVNQVVNFELVRAVSDAGGTDVVDVKNAVDAVLQLEGDWLDEVLAG